MATMRAPLSNSAPSDGSLKEVYVNNIESSKAPREPLAMCDDDGFVPIQRQTIDKYGYVKNTTIDRSQPDKKFYKPMPTKITLADYVVSKNTFASLAEDEKVDTTTTSSPKRVEAAEKASITMTNRGQPATSMLKKNVDTTRTRDPGTSPTARTTTPSA